MPDKLDETEALKHRIAELEKVVLQIAKKLNGATKIEDFERLEEEYLHYVHQPIITLAVDRQ